MDIYATVYNLAPAGEYDVSFEWDDSILTDTEQQTHERLLLLDAGIISKIDFRMWYFGETRSQAKAAIESLQQEQMESMMSMLPQLNSGRSISMKECYTQQPKEIEVFTHNGISDVIIRRGVTATQNVINDEGETQDVWECDETQFRYPGVLSCEEISSQLDKWLLYAAAEGINELERLKQSAIEDASVTCNSVIRAGFTIELSDHKPRHFSLEITDQITISQLAKNAAEGQPFVPWHADGEACRFYSAADISAINAEMEALILYQQTYFNSYKCWINGTESIDELNSMQYGMPIPEKYQSEVMKALLTADSSV